jgi:hypothetical protein
VMTPPECWLKTGVPIDPQTCFFGFNHFKPHPCINSSIFLINIYTCINYKSIKMDNWYIYINIYIHKYIIYIYTTGYYWISWANPWFPWRPGLRRSPGRGGCFGGSRQPWLSCGGAARSWGWPWFWGKEHNDLDKNTIKKGTSSKKRL